MRITLVMSVAEKLAWASRLREFEFGANISYAVRKIIQRRYSYVYNGNSQDPIEVDVEQNTPPKLDTFILDDAFVHIEDSFSMHVNIDELEYWKVLRFREGYNSLPAFVISTMREALSIQAPDFIKIDKMMIEDRIKNKQASKCVQ